MKTESSLPTHRVLMITALTHLMAGNKDSAKRKLKKVKIEVDKFYESHK